MNDLNIQFTARACEIPQGFKELATKKLEKALRVDSSLEDIHVEIKKNNNPSRSDDHIVEISAVSRKNKYNVRAEEASISFESALDLVIDDFRRVVRKEKTKRDDFKNGNKASLPPIGKQYPGKIDIENQDVSSTQDIDNEYQSSSD